VHMRTDKAQDSVIFLNIYFKKNAHMYKSTYTRHHHNIQTFVPSKTPQWLQSAVTVYEKCTWKQQKILALQKKKTIY
jgi:hypothetical protein